MGRSFTFLTRQKPAWVNPISYGSSGPENRPVGKNVRCQMDFCMTNRNQKDLLPKPIVPSEPTKLSANRRNLLH